MSEHIHEFKQAVNMTAIELEKWLSTNESKGVGQHIEGSSEAIGHVSGRHIAEILRKNGSTYSEADEEQMKRTASYVKRHLAQRPDGNVRETHWRYSLMNWGNDPLKGE